MGRHVSSEVIGIPYYWLLHWICAQHHLRQNDARAPIYIYIHCCMHMMYTSDSDVSNIFLVSISDVHLTFRLLCISDIPGIDI